MANGDLSEYSACAWNQEFATLVHSELFVWVASLLARSGYCCKQGNLSF